MADAPRVRILDPATVDKIAAGEVVDRPAAVLKELVENALDAGATTVRVRLQGPMGASIVVSDDGRGMSADDALLALERHATSKIAEAADLETVVSLGFRGEALPSIASVSAFTLETRRREDEVGTRVEVDGGTLRSRRPASLPAGTTVTVRDLFRGVPVRRKFLRSEATERGHLVRSFLRLALAHPEVRMELELDGRTLFVLPAAESLLRRVRDAFGGEVAAALLPVAAEAGTMRLEGFVGDPARLPPGSWQYFLLNRRPVDDRLLHATVREGFARTAVRTDRPDFILSLSVDPRDVDVNVHPSKREVRFRSPSAVAGLVSAAVARALTGGETPAAGPGKGAAAPSGVPWAASAPLLLRDGPEAGFVPSAPGESPSLPGERRLLGQALAGWLVVAEPERILLVDQHAAHERVLYERVLDRLRGGAARAQQLLVPAELEVQPQDADRVHALLPLLERAGATLEPSGPRTFRVTALPPEIPPSDVGAFVRNLIGLASEAGEELEHDPSWWDKPAALTACHGAVKLGDQLSLPDMDRLLRDLLACRDPLRCPHGRPTTVALDRAALERLFGRR